MKEDKVYIKYKEFAKYYKLSNYDTKKLWRIIEPIAVHKEFSKRCSDPYFHHDIKTLGDHILCDAIVTYKLATKLKRNSQNMKDINIDNAVVIAMFHDLYELPWQNIGVKKIMRNKHGFVHPIEAITNAITWYPEYFKSKERAMIIIDGVIHHMFPLAVRCIDDTEIELNNQEKYEKLPQKYKDMIKLSTDIGKIGHYSLRKSFFIEGRIMSRADKIVAFKKDIGSFNGYLALLSGKNKNIKTKHNKNADKNETRNSKWNKTNVENVKKVLEIIKKNHPYETPGIDIIPLMDENLFN